MKLYEARERAKKEVSDMLNTHNLTMKQVEDYSKRNPLSGMVRLTHYEASTTSNFIRMKAAEIRKVS